MSNRTMYLILAGLCFLVYANSLNGAFVSDDIPVIVKNPDMAHPLQYLLAPPALLNSLTFLAAKLNPFLYHLVNIILHSIATILVFVFLKLFFKAEASFLGACIFAVHPIHAEAVTWISGIGHLTMGLFVLISYLLYVRAAKGMEGKKGMPDFRYYLACLAVFFYVINYQVSFYVFTPCLFMFSDLTFNKWRKRWKLWLPFIALVAFRVFVVRGLITGRAAAVAKEMGTGITWTNPIYNMAYSLFSHLGLIIWPWKLTIYHEPPVITRTLLNIELVVMALFVLALPFIFKKARPVFFAVGVFVLFLAPTYSPILISWLVAERYVYFPFVAISMALAFAYEKYAQTSEIHRRRAMTVFIALIACYAARTVVRNEDWKTPGRLWRSTAEVSPDSPRAHNNLGDAYFQEGNVEGAIKEFKRSTEIKPDYSDAYHNLANTFQFIGDIKDAIPNYEKAVSLNPNLYESWYNLGVCYINIGDTDRASRSLSRALQIKPQDPAALSALMFALKKQNEKK